ncbi:hypothetical protein MTR72_16420 [Bradyrhizobium sp. ISRA442]|uniref:hypothetical protein n=1 Tax=Bradyrhizobium sp. ISRA442 TaxID=2866197 RepID=UPI00311B35C3
MSDIETKSISNRTILIALLIFNVIGIGLSEVQRMRLGQQSTDAVVQLQAIERQRLAEQAADLDRTYRLIAGINERVNNVEIALQSGPLASQIKDIHERLMAIQIKIEASTAAK